MNVSRIDIREPAVWPYRPALTVAVGLLGVLDIRREGDSIIIDTRPGEVALTPTTAIAIADFLREAATKLRDEINLKRLE